MAKPYKRKDSKCWWIAPWIEGQQVRQSSGETNYDLALRKLRILEGKIAANAPITPKTDRGSFAALLELVRTDYKIKNRRSLYDLEKRLDVQLISRLGHLPAPKAWTELDNYILARKQEGASNGTINNELRIVRRAYKLGERKGLVSYAPHIEMLPDGEPRDGYYSPAEFKDVLARCGNDELLKDILITAYITGWRLRSIFRLELNQVDEDFIWQTERKNDKATRWPLDVTLDQVGVSLREVIERRRAAARLQDQIVPWIFHRKGRPVKSIRGSFEKALGSLPRVFHDFRGTAIVNLLEACVDEATIMNLVGLKTNRMIIHYAKKRGMRDARLKEAGKLLEMRLGNGKKREEA